MLLLYVQMLQVVNWIGATELRAINVDFRAHSSRNSLSSFSDSRKKKKNKIYGSFFSSMDISGECHQASWWKSQECLNLWVPSQLLNSLSPRPQPGGLCCAIAWAGWAQKWVWWAAMCWQAGKEPCLVSEGVAVKESKAIISGSAFDTQSGYCTQKISRFPKLKIGENFNCGTWGAALSCCEVAHCSLLVVTCFAVICLLS